MKNNTTLIIAEAGVNHNGSINLAKELIDVAVEAGADFVKFQTFKAETLVTQTAYKAEYQKEVIDRLEKVEEARNSGLRNFQQLQELQSSLLQKAFRGDL